MSPATHAGLWGLLSGSARVLGAGIAWFLEVPQRLIAAVMAFGSGVLISAPSFELMDEAYRSGGFLAAAAGLIGGAGVYTAANIYLSQRGARHRKRSGSSADSRQPSNNGAGMAIALGSLLDGIPESVVIGVSMLGGKSVSFVAVVATFLSNVPEGLSGSAGMKRVGRSAAYVLGSGSR